MLTAGFNNPSVQRTSEDKTTDVNITPYFSPHESSVRAKYFSKSSSVDNQEETGGFEDGGHSAPTIHEDFRPVKLTANDQRKTQKLAMKKFIMGRGVRKSKDLGPLDSSGISQDRMDVSSLVRQAVKSGKNVALKQAKTTAAHDPQETTTEGMNKLLKMAMQWKREHSVPIPEVKPSRDTGSIVDLEDITPTSAEATNTVKSAKSDFTESKLNLNLSTTKSTAGESDNLDSKEPVKTSDLKTADSTEPVFTPKLDTGDSTEPVITPNLDTDYSTEPVFTPNLDTTDQTEPVITPNLDSADSTEPIITPNLDTGDSTEPVITPNLDTGDSTEPVITPNLDSRC